MSEQYFEAALSVGAAGTTIGGGAAKWRNYFRRVSAVGVDPRFYVKGSREYLYSDQMYHEGHSVLDQLIAVCEKDGLEAYGTDYSAPGHSVSAYIFKYDFKDGGLSVSGGNHCNENPPHGAYILGFGALRHMLRILGLEQPRRLGGEAELNPRSQR